MITLIICSVCAFISGCFIGSFQIHMIWLKICGYAVTNELPKGRSETYVAGYLEGVDTIVLLVDKKLKRWKD